MDFVTLHASEIGSFISGLVTGIAGSFLTVRMTKRVDVSGNGRVVDQSRARAGGDIVGGNKTSGGRTRK